MSKDITIFVCGNSISSAHRDQYGELPDSAGQSLHEADIAFDMQVKDGRLELDVFKNRSGKGLVINHLEGQS